MKLVDPLLTVIMGSWLNMEWIETLTWVGDHNFAYFLIYIFQFSYSDVIKMFKFN